MRFKFNKISWSLIDIKELMPMVNKIKTMMTKRHQMNFWLIFRMNAKSFWLMLVHRKPLLIYFIRCLLDQCQFRKLSSWKVNPYLLTHTAHKNLAFNFISHTLESLDTTHLMSVLGIKLLLVASQIPLMLFKQEKFLSKMH